MVHSTKLGGVGFVNFCALKTRNDQKWVMLTNFAFSCRSTSNIYMFRLTILSEIEIQNYLRSNQVTKSHQRSNLSKTCQKRVNRADFTPIGRIWPKFDHDDSNWPWKIFNLNSWEIFESKYILDIFRLIRPFRPQFDDSTQVRPILIFKLNH